MHGQFLAGVVFAWAIAYIGIGLSFCLAFLVFRRQPEHLAFGLHAQMLAVYSIGFALGYATPEATVGLHLAVAGAIASAALELHFALIYAQVESHAVIMRPVYACAIVLEGVSAWFGPFHTDQPAIVMGRIGPFFAEHVGVRASPLGAVVVTFIVLCELAGAGQLTRAVLGGQRHCVPPFLGAAFLGAAAVHDSLLSLGVLHDTWIGPAGDAAFMFVVTGGFIVRSATVKRELTEQSLELKRRSGELRRSYEELREAQRELTRKEQLAAVGELAAVIAHEVRNPLAIISNAVAALHRREIAHADRETLLAILKEEAARLNRLVGDLLRYARPVRPQRQLLSVREIIERTLVSAGLRESVVTELREEGELPQVWGDADLLRQVFDNLVDNAIQAMPVSPGRHRTLVVSLRPETHDGVSGARVDVSDSGEGMAPHVRARAMDPFFTTRPSGTGLGLAIVDRIVEAHEGAIWISSTPKAGTTVTVFLPVGMQLPEELLSSDHESGANRALNFDPRGS